MIEVTSQRKDKESGNLIITILLPHPREGFVRYSPEQIDKHLDSLKIKRGKITNPMSICNKPGHALRYELIYTPVAKRKTSQKPKQKLDNKTESVIIKKENTRRTKSGG